MRSACIGEPVSWLLLERRALGELAGDAAARVEQHLGACEACRACAARISDDARELPPLPAVLRRAPVRSRGSLVALGALAAAASVLVAIDLGAPRDDLLVPGVKGGEAALTVLAERGGELVRDPPSLAPGDRLKVAVTCAARAPVAAEVVVIQGESRAFPLARVASLSCGNAVVVPGAFTVDPGPATICVVLGAPLPDRAALEKMTAEDLARHGACWVAGARGSGQGAHRPP